MRQIPNHPERPGLTTRALRLGGTIGQTFLRCAGHLALLTALSLANATLQADEEEVFTQAIKTALEKKDPAALVEMADREGLNEAELTQLVESIGALLAYPDVYSVSLGPLPEDFAPFYILNSKRYQTTKPAEGLVTVTFKADDGLTSTQRAYATTDGKYRLLAVKQTDLGWEGPPDVNIAYAVEGIGADDAVVKVKFNASGVTVERTLHSPSAILWGQHFDEIFVNSQNSQSKLTLKIVEGSTQIYESKTLQGVGTITYQRPDSSSIKKPAASGATEKTP